MTKPEIFKQFIVRFFRDLTYTISAYVDKVVYKRALKEKDVVHVVALTALGVDDVEKFAKEFIENMKIIDYKPENDEQISTR